MPYGICHIALAPIRAEASDTSEMVSQILFGETLKILETQNQWCRVRIQFDQYVGWVDEKQFISLNEDEFENANNKVKINNHLFLNASSEERDLTLPLGASLPGLKGDGFSINNELISLHKKINTDILSIDKLIKIALSLKETPYLWGGRSPMGIDCSGFTQLIYKCVGIDINRDAKDQVYQGKPIKSLSEAQKGDLAFFINQREEIHHVGLILDEYKIIHAAGKVRVDQITKDGIYNNVLKKLTHRLHSIKRMII